MAKKKSDEPQELDPMREAPPERPYGEAAAGAEDQPTELEKPVVEK